MAELEPAVRASSADERRREVLARRHRSRSGSTFARLARAALSGRRRLADDPLRPARRHQYAERVRGRAPQALRLRARRPRAGNRRRARRSPSAARRSPLPPRARVAARAGRRAHRDHGLLRRPAASTRRSSIATQLAAGRSRSSGPAIVCEDVSTTVIDPGWEAEVLSGGELLVDARSAADAAARGGSRRPTADPVMLEIFNNHFAGHRRADGHHAAQHGEQREREGAARFQLRAVHGRRATWSSTRRTFRCTWARWARPCAA